MIVANEVGNCAKHVFGIRRFWHPGEGKGHPLTSDLTASPMR